MSERKRIDPFISDDVDFSRSEIDDAFSDEKGVIPSSGKKWSKWGFWKTLLIGYLATWVSVILFILSFYVSLFSVSFKVMFSGIFENGFSEIISLSIGPLIFLVSITLVFLVVSKYIGSNLAKAGMFMLILFLWALSIGTSIWFLTEDINFPFISSRYSPDG